MPTTSNEGSSGQKQKYTFSQLISSVEELKKKFEMLKSENKMLKENTENILKQVLNMESQLISNGCILERFKIRSDQAFDQLLTSNKNSKDNSKTSNELSVNGETNKDVNSGEKESKTIDKKIDSTTQIKIEKIEQVKLNIKEELEDNSFEELEEEACLDPNEGETEEEYVEVQENYLKIETDESQANIFDIEQINDRVKLEPLNSVNTTIANETCINSSSENASEDSDTDDEYEKESLKPKEYSLKRLHMDLVEYLDKNKKKPKVTPTKKQTSQKEEEVYCVCKSTHSADNPMIGCDGPCKDWYHFHCVGIPQDFRSIAEWYCEACFLEITGGVRDVCLCGGSFEPAHELIRCRGKCRRLYHPGCLGLDNEDLVTRWEKDGGGQCGFCNG